MQIEERCKTYILLYSLYVLNCQILRNIKNKATLRYSTYTYFTQ